MILKIQDRSMLSLVASMVYAGARAFLASERLQLLILDFQILVILTSTLEILRFISEWFKISKIFPPKIWEVRAVASSILAWPQLRTSYFFPSFLRSLVRSFLPSFLRRSTRSWILVNRLNVVVLDIGSWGENLGNFFQNVIILVRRKWK